MNLPEELTVTDQFADEEMTLEKKWIELGPFVLRQLDLFGEKCWGKGFFNKPYQVINGQIYGDTIIQPGYWEVRHKTTVKDPTRGLGILIMLDDPANRLEGAAQYDLVVMTSDDKITLVCAPDEASLQATLNSIYEKWEMNPNQFLLK